ncbi:GNAT family N-acetyltransferase [Paenibacillus sp. N1-5-1-14]|uniref:GNAT family N-acetyltransferase n=1 Tax=Paenibacillus radicibacter TaxID=2972488 RepID=UPI0021595E78|nr:GNAT family N-acetyltransferase [Paenibacillus radicibacter]MCR8644704.1 GNAT family N-acetyltransferase [Paenibacillus radicibacter]
MIASIEERSLNAWPALETVLSEGWVLRFADGYTKRANSIQPIYGCSEDVISSIETCEALYTSKGLNTVFKITPITYPSHLDAILEDRKYTVVDHTSVQTVSLQDLREPSLCTVDSYEEVTDEWLSAYCRLSQASEQHRPTMKRMFEHLVPQACFMILKDEGQAVACGMAVIERGYIGLFDVVTDADRRKKGYGEQLILNLLHFGIRNGAHHSYLQVVKSNAAALRLYEKLGYLESYSYWYRVQA